MQKSLFRNMIYKILLNVSNILLPFLIGLFVVRIMDKDAYDAYNTANAELQFFIIAGSFGILNFAVREISKIRDNKRSVEIMFTNLFVLGTLTNAIALVVYIVYGLFVPNTDMLLHYILAFQIFANAFNVEWLNEAAENFGFITKKTILVKILYAVLVFVFLSQNNSVYVYGILISLVNIFLNNIISFVYIKRRIRLRPKKIKLTNYLRPVSIIFLTTNVGMLFTQLDKFMLKWSDFPYAVTVYQLPDTLTSLLTTLMSSVVFATVPRLNYYVANGKQQEYQDLLKRSCNTFVMILAPCIVGIAGLSSEIINLYTQGKYMDASPILFIFSIRLLLTAIHSVVTYQIMYVYNREKQLFIAFGLGGVTNLVVNLLLIFTGWMQPVTSIISTMVIELVMLLSICIYITRSLKVSLPLLNKQNVRYFLLALLFIPIIIVVKLLSLGTLLTSIMSFAICGLLYAGALMLVKDEIAMMIFDRTVGAFWRRLPWSKK